MIIAKHRILQVYAVTYGPEKDEISRFHEVANVLGLDTEIVAKTVTESLGVLCESLN